MKLIILLALAFTGCASASHDREVASIKSKLPNPADHNITCSTITPMSVRFMVIMKKPITEASVIYSSRDEPHNPQTFKVKMKETAQAFEFRGSHFELTMPKDKFTTNGVGDPLAVSSFNGEADGQSIPYHEVNCVFN